MDPGDRSGPLPGGCVMRARTYSHPARWMFGGVLQEWEWQGGPARVRLWDGSEADVGDGDVVLALHTPAHVQPVRVTPVALDQANDSP